MIEIQSGIPFQVLMGLSHDTLHAYIVSLVLEALLFGTFTVTYTMGACSLLKSLVLRRHSARDWVLLCASTAMFGLTLAHLVLSLRLTFIVFPEHSEGGGQCHSAMPIETTAVFPVWYGRLGIYVSQTLIGDVFMIYRLFIVWNRSKRIIVLPATLCLVNAVCGYLTLGPLTTTFILLGFILLSLVSNVLCSVLIIWRVLRSANQSTPFAARLKLYQKVAEAIVQSAAIYSTASIALGLTFFFNPNNKPGFLVCLAVFPPLIGLVFSFIVLRMARNSAEEAGRRSSHAGNGGVDKRHTIITPNRRSLSVQLHMPPFPPPAFHLATLDFLEDAQAMESSNASTNSVKPTEPLTRNNLSLAEDRHLEGPPGECNLDVLDIRTSKSSWSESGELR